MQKYIKNLFNFILIFTIIYLINKYLSIEYTAACGLFAFIGSEPDKYYNKLNFNILGVFNDTRGGDGCGIITPGYFEKVTTSKYSTLFKDAIIEKTIETPETIYHNIFGHTRKASVGGVSDVYTQPFTISKNHPLVIAKMHKNKDYTEYVKELPKHSIVFSGVHNGTISNYIELAKEYGINASIEKKNDTQVLYEILYKEKYEILSKYIGAASLIFQNYYTDDVYIFRGESSNYKEGTVNSEERPLWFWEVAPNNYYISSIKDSLRFIGATEEQVKIVPANTLFIFNKGKKIKEIPIDRSKAYQKENTYIAPVNNWRKNDSEYSNWNKPNVGFNYNNKNKHYNNNDYSDYNKNDKDNTTIFLLNKSSLKNWNYEALRSDYSSKRMIYNKGRYWINGNLAHGIFPIADYGVVPVKNSAHVSQKYKLYYFIEGMLIEELQDYISIMSEYIDKLEELLSLNLATSISYKDVHLLETIREIDIIDFEQAIISLVIDYSLFPIQSLFKLGQTGYVKNSTSSTFFSGIVKAPFSRRNYAFSGGNLIKIESDYTIENITKHTNDDHALALQYIEDPLLILKEYEEFGYVNVLYDYVGQYLLPYNYNDKYELNGYESFLTRVLKRRLEITNTSIKKAVNFVTPANSVLLAQGAYSRTFMEKVCTDCQFNHLPLDELCIYCVNEPAYNNNK